MHHSLTRKEIVPFAVQFGSLVLATAVVDLVLHRAGLVAVGRWLGIPGTLLILLSFLYSLRKRRLLRQGRLVTFLRAHEILAWVGTLMILVHAGIHIYTVLPWLALLAMLVNVASGMTGTYLLARSRDHLAARRGHYAQQGLADAEVDRQLFRDATSYELMKKWRAVHLPITVVFAGLALAHIVSIFMFWGWR
jgi:hypothetical protein